MTVQELVARFPEIPADLHGDPVIERFASTLGPLLSLSNKPSPCSTQHDAGNHYYLKLIGPLSIYGYGLTSREKLLAQLEELIERHDADPDGFAASLLPGDVVDREVRGPGCD
jgi:hypothetical protein